MIEKFPDQIDVVVTPYTAKTKVLPRRTASSTRAEVQLRLLRHQALCQQLAVQGRQLARQPAREEDDRLARLAIRYILCNPAITAPIPGMINPHQVDNVALAVKERRELDMQEKAELERAMDRAWANLPPHYQWLKDWEYCVGRPETPRQASSLPDRFATEAP